MSITPIEMYTMTPKSQETANMRHAEISKDNAYAAAKFENLSTEIRANAQKTVKSTETENNDYRYDAKEKGNGSYSQSGRGKPGGKKKQEEEFIKNLSTRPGGIDIKV